MSEITELTEAVKELTKQLKGGPNRGGPEDRRREKIEDLQERQRLLRDEEKLINRIGRSDEEKAKLLNERNLEEIANTKELLKLNALEGEEKEKAIQRLIRLTEESEDFAESTEKTSKALKTQSQAFKAGAAEAENMLEGFLGLSAEGKRFFSIVGNGTTSLLGFAQGLAKSVISGQLFINVVKKIIGNSINFAFELDRQNAQFKRATGAGNEYASSIQGAGLAFQAYGIDAKDAGLAATNLFGSFRDFTNLSESERTNIITTTAALEKFGISSQTTGKILDQATKSLYMNGQEAELLARQAATLAVDVGKPMSEVAGDLSTAAPKLAFYGKQMFDVFAQLERQSKATGLSVDSLLGVVGEKFDTFEGAGQAVGRLNAILGGPYLNSIDMLNATESERVEMIKEAIKANGVQFDQLNKFEQKAFASALGTDVDTMRRMLNELDPEVERQALRQEQLAKKAGDARDVMSKLKDAINSLIISFGPYITKISESINKFSDFIQKVNQGKASFKDVEFGVGKLAMGLFAVGSALKVFGFMLSPLKLVGRLARRSAVDMKDLGNEAGKAATRSSKLFGGRAALLRGGLLGLGGAAAGYATSKGIDYFKSKGQIGAAQGTSVLGGAATGALTGAAVGSVIPVIGTGIGALVGGAIGLAYGSDRATKIQDGQIRIAQFDNKDTFERVSDGIVAAKPDGTLDKAIRESSARQTEVLVKAIHEAMRVKVYVGDEELGAVVTKGMNSTKGRNAISAFFEG